MCRDVLEHVIGIGAIDQSEQEAAEEGERVIVQDVLRECQHDGVGCHARHTPARHLFVSVTIDDTSQLGGCHQHRQVVQRHAIAEVTIV